MKKGKSPRNSEAKVQKVNRSFLIPHVLDKNLEAFCTQQGLSKCAVLQRALQEYLERQGMQPTLLPKIQILY